MSDDLEMKTGITRRQAIQRGAIISTAIWVPPLIQSIRMPARAQVAGSPPPCVVDTGFMTGDGFAYISGTSGPKIHYKTSGPASPGNGNLNCAPTGSETLEVDWKITTGSGRNKVTHNYEFDMTSLTSIACSINGSYPIGPNANFNETAGSGTGTLLIDGVAQPGTATLISFVLTDAGEPSIGHDLVSFRILYPGNAVYLDVAGQPLTQGNLQTHGNTAFGNACDAHVA